MYSLVLTAHSRGFKPQASTNACGHVCKYVYQKGSTAMLTSIQSAGVAPKVNLKITHVRKCGRDPPWLWNPGQTSPEVQNRGISGPAKRALCPPKHVKKERNIIEWRQFIDSRTNVDNEFTLIKVVFYWNRMACSQWRTLKMRKVIQKANPGFLQSLDSCKFWLNFERTMLCDW